MVRSRVVKIGDSVMLALPPDILQACGIAANGVVTMSVDEKTGALVLKAASAPCTLDEILGESRGHAAAMRLCAAR